jgi:hypothetical protein
LDVLVVTVGAVELLQEINATQQMESIEITIVLNRVILVVVLKTNIQIIMGKASNDYSQLHLARAFFEVYGMKEKDFKNKSVTNEVVSLLN